MENKKILIANIDILPGFEEPVKNAVIALAIETRKEPGSEQFLIHTQDDQPRKIVFYEIYQSAEAFEWHKTTAPAKAFFEFVKGKIKDDKIGIVYLSALA